MLSPLDARIITDMIAPKGEDLPQADQAGDRPQGNADNWMLLGA